MREKYVMICELKRGGRTHAIDGKTLEALNEKYKEELKIPFQATLGTPRFRGVLISKKAVFRVLTDAQCNPDIRCGIGSWQTANHALDYATEEKTDIAIKTRSSKLDWTITTLASLIRSIKKRWTKRQAQIIGWPDSHPEATQAEVAEHFMISQQAVSKIIRSTALDTVKEGEKLLDAYLDLALKEGA